MEKENKEVTVEQMEVEADMGTTEIDPIMEMGIM